MLLKHVRRHVSHVRDGHGRAKTAEGRVQTGRDKKTSVGMSVGLVSARDIALQGTLQRCSVAAQANTVQVWASHTSIWTSGHFWKPVRQFEC